MMEWRSKHIQLADTGSFSVAAINEGNEKKLCRSGDLGAAFGQERTVELTNRDLAQLGCS